MRLKDAKPEGRIAAGFQTRGVKTCHTHNAVCKDGKLPKRGTPRQVKI